MNRDFVAAEQALRVGVLRQLLMLQPEKSPRGAQALAWFWQVRKSMRQFKQKTQGCTN
jgi:hypothetical protein